MNDYPLVKPIPMLSLLAMVFCFNALGHSGELERIERWGVYELSLQQPST